MRLTRVAAMPLLAMLAIEGGNITTQFDVFDETTFKNAWPTDSYLFATGRMPPPPAGLDARIVHVEICLCEDSFVRLG
jgi:hypothetical protein